MALTLSTLADELENLFNSLGAPGFDAGTAWGVAFGNYFLDATLGGVPVTASAVDTAAAAMGAAITFSNSTGDEANPDQIGAGLVALWGAIAAAPATFWPAALSPVVVPAGFVGGPGSTASIAILAAFGTNQDAAITRPQAAAALAAAIHPNGLGGSAVVGVTPTAIL